MSSTIASMLLTLKDNTSTTISDTPYDMDVTEENEHDDVSALQIVASAQRLTTTIAQTLMTSMASDESSDKDTCHCKKSKCLKL